MLRFSTGSTNLRHKFSRHTAFQRALQLAELDYIAGSKVAQTAIAEQYTALNLTDD